LFWIAILLALGVVAIWVQDPETATEPTAELASSVDDLSRTIPVEPTQMAVDRASTLIDPPVSSWVLEGYATDQEVISIEPWSGSVENRVGRSATSVGSYRWLEGADGFREAVEEARDRNTGLVVYFYTDWCGYCRQLERDLLNTGAVDRYLQTLPRVRVNPEKGQLEQSLARGYGVRGFPSFFVHSSVDRRPQKIRQHVREADGWRLQRPAEFVASLRRVAG